MALSRLDCRKDVRRITPVLAGLVNPLTLKRDRSQMPVTDRQVASLSAHFIAGHFARNLMLKGWKS
jgi:hypothetical protein